MTIPDYTPVEPGQRIDKIWRVRNSGTCPWDAGYLLAYAGGDQMGAPPSQAVVNTPPGGTADIQVTMYAPGSPGTYQGTWRMRDASGQPFGTPLTVIVTVPGGAPGSSGSATPTEVSGGSSGCSPTVNFRADDAVIADGESTTLRWDVECVREVYFEGGPVTGHESRVVTPHGVTVYTLRVVRNDGGSEEHHVTVDVTAGGVSVVEDEPTEVRVSIAYHSYDAGTGIVWFAVTSEADSMSVGRVDRRIWNFSSDEVYYYGYTLHSFYSSPNREPCERSSQARRSTSIAS